MRVKCLAPEHDAVPWPGLEPGQADVESSTLKDPSQPAPFSMLSKLLILHSEAKSYCFIVNCVPESMFNYL